MSRSTVQIGESYSFWIQSSQPYTRSATVMDGNRVVCQSAPVTVTLY